MRGKVIQQRWRPVGTGCRCGGGDGAMTADRACGGAGERESAGGARQASDGGIGVGVGAWGAGVAERLVGGIDGGKVAALTGVAMACGGGVMALVGGDGARRAGGTCRDGAAGGGVGTRKAADAGGGRGRARRGGVGGGRTKADRVPSLAPRAVA